MSALSGVALRLTLLHSSFGSALEVFGRPCSVRQLEFALLSFLREAILCRSATRRARLSKLIWYYDSTYHVLAFVTISIQCFKWP